MKFKLLLILLLVASITFSQNCEPSKSAEQKNGDTVDFYGGRIRSGGFGSNDKSIYNLFIAQVNNGEKGTIVCATLFEPVDSKEQYNNAVNNFLNENNLKNSVLEIQLNGKVIRIPSSNSTSRPEKFLGSISAYSVFFEGEILKSQIELMQEYNLQKFRLVVGGHPYERYFKKPTKRTKKLKENFKCVNMENVFEMEKKDASEMDLTEVTKEEYSKSIIGKWSTQGKTGQIVEFDNDSKIKNSKMGRLELEGSYKIVGNRIIVSTDNGNSISEISMFLKDMLILKENGNETTYERVE
jgi:hypothetical protein